MKFTCTGQCVVAINGKVLVTPIPVAELPEPDWDSLYGQALEFPSYACLFAALESTFPGIMEVWEGSRHNVKAVSVWLDSKFPTTPDTCEDYKRDSGKLDYTLLMHDMAASVEKLVSCLHWGHHTKGYPRNGYKTLPGGPDRLLAACYRHLRHVGQDFNAVDEESGLPHIVHAVTNLLMAMEQENSK